MPDTFQRVARPSAEFESSSPGVATARGINRSQLTLFITVFAMLLSVAGAGVNLYIFFGGGQQKTLNEADQILLQAQASRILRENDINPKLHPNLGAELTRLYANLSYQPGTNAPLTVFERVAFALVVESYANPIRDVQLKRSEVLTKLGLTLSSRDMCDIDPNDPKCPDNWRRSSPTSK